MATTRASSRAARRWPTFVLLLALTTFVGPAPATRAERPATVLAEAMEVSAWAWGANDAGQLADGTPDHRDLPVPVRGADGTGRLGEIVAVAGSSFQDNANRRSGFSLGLDRRGQVWAWGRTGLTDSPFPQPVRRGAESGALDGIVAIAAGWDHALALDRDGRVWAWGRNDLGQLGDNVPLSRTLPALARKDGHWWGGTPPRWTAVAAGGGHSLALDNRGQVWAWGSNAFGQLGRWLPDIGTDPRSPYPVQLRGRSEPLGNIVAVAAGSDHSLALERDGRVWAWGLGQPAGEDGRFDDCGGEGQVLCQRSPVVVTGLPPIAAVVAGMGHSLVLDRQGGVWAWGAGTGAQNAPVRMPGLGRVVAVAAGAGHRLALGADGTVWAWGNDDFGQLGDGAASIGSCGPGTPPSCLPTPVRVPDLPRIVAIAAGGSLSLALDRDGRVWSWGADVFGQLGDGPGAPDSCRVSVANTATDYPCATGPVPVPGLTGIVAIAAGGAKNQELYGGAYRTMPTADFALALDGAGQLLAWGANATGQLGDGSRVGRDQPMPVQDAANSAPRGGVIALAAGGEHALALQATDPAAEVCFTQTGYCLRGRFLDSWRDHGGLALHGFPLSDERRELLEDGRAYTVQYCERVRLEHHPENAAPNDILLGQVGRRFVAAVPGAPTAPVAPLPGARFFASTGHNVARPAFVAFWDAHGGLAQFGYPLTEEFVEEGRWVQYFERARFEWHSEYAGWSDEVQLGQLGRRALAER